MITNKNKTEIAPIYNNIIIKDRNSISKTNKTKLPVTIKKTRLSIEYKTLLEKITITAKKRLTQTRSLKINILKIQ
jgi:hypothetical protein